MEKIRSRFDRVLASALVGGIVGGLVPVLTCGRSTVQGIDTRGWLGLLIPLFCMIGAFVGAAGATLFLVLGSFRNSMVDAANSVRNERVGPGSEEWNNPSNWTAGLFYKSRVDRRIFVPQKLPGGWFTINLGQPAGIAIAVVLLVVLVITIVSMVHS